MAATRAVAPQTPFFLPIAQSSPDSAPLLTDYGGGALFVSSGTGGAGEMTPRADVTMKRVAPTRSSMLAPAGEEGSSVPHQSMLAEAHDPIWPTITRSPHISSMAPVVWSEEVGASETIAAQKSSMQVKSAIFKCTFSKQRRVNGDLTFACLLQPSQMKGNSMKQANRAVESIWNQDGIEKQLEPVHYSRRWRSGQDYPAAPPITPSWTTDLLSQVQRGTGREHDRTGRGSAHQVCASEASQHRKTLGHSHFMSPSLIHSRTPSAPLIEIEPSLLQIEIEPSPLHGRTLRRWSAPSPLLQSSLREQRAVNQYDATPPEFGLSAEIIYNTVDTHWASFVRNVSFTTCPNGVNLHRDHSSGNYAELIQVSAMAQQPASPMHERASTLMPQRASSTMMQGSSNLVMQRSALPTPAPVPMKQGSTTPPLEPVPTTLKQGNDPNGVLSHPMLSQQFAQFLDEQRKKGGLSGNISDINWALRIGKTEERAGEKGPPGTPVPDGTGNVRAGGDGGLSSESAHVIAREIARLQASRAEDAERLKALTQRKGG